jgi:DNA replication and repair protein RecF
VSGYLEEPGAAGGAGRIWVSKLTLTDFRNYRGATLQCGPDCVVLLGGNGAGKTNCLEAISLLTAGRGLRALPFSELAHREGPGGWAVAARLFAGDSEMKIGTGIQPQEGGAASRTARTVKIDDAISKSSGALARVRMLWLTPAMDGLFTGPASERRRFVDRFVLSLDPSYAAVAAAFDRAMRQRNKALETESPPQLLTALEAQMAAAAVRIAEARTQAIEALASEIQAERDRDAQSAFPWSEVALTGHLETQIASVAAPEVEASYCRLLAQMRERDRAAARTLIGPHRSDLEVAHGPKGMPAKMCSTGEQKALLVGLVLAQARLIKSSGEHVAPLILLDEIAAHLDFERRLALFASIASLEAQVWMTGTDRQVFEPFRQTQAAQFFLVSNGAFIPANDEESALKH